MSNQVVSVGKLWKRVLVAGCLTAGFAALPMRAEDAKPAEKPAATADTPRVDPAQLLKIMRDRLDQVNLTDEQKKKVDEIFSSGAEELKKADAGDRQGRMKIIAGIREKAMGVLTDEQKAKMSVRGAGAAGQRFNLADRLAAALEKADLSSEQKAKTQPIIEDVRKKFDELRTQVKDGDRTGLREKVKTLLDETRDKLKDILTPEQAEKVKSALEAGRPGAKDGAAKPAEKTAEK